MVEIPGKKQSDRRLYRFIDTKGNTLFDIPAHLRLGNVQLQVRTCGGTHGKRRNGIRRFHRRVPQNAIPEAIGIGPRVRDNESPNGCSERDIDYQVTRSGRLILQIVFTAGRRAARLTRKHRNRN